jgi:site-specific recombinase XerD
MKRIISLKMLLRFKRALLEEEKSKATVDKYIHDVKVFLEFSLSRAVDKNLVIEYKSYLIDKYAVASANSMLSALNEFFRFLGWGELTVKKFRVQKDAFCPEERELTKEEYLSLVRAAKKQNNCRLALIIQTICASGIRVSELPYITVEAIARGEAVVDCKNKLRRIFIVTTLQKILAAYAKENKISTGPIFITRNGNPITRNNIWREMKALCKEARVNEKKVYPHNLRHLFATTFYKTEKDIAKLADILGHTSINTTRTYITTSSKEHKRKLENMRLII